MSQSAYQRWEAGLGHPSVEHLGPIADFIGATSEEMLALTGQEPPSSLAALQRQVQTLTDRVNALDREARKLWAALEAAEHKYQDLSNEVLNQRSVLLSELKRSQRGS